MSPLPAEYGSAERYRRAVRTFSLKSNPLRLSCDEIPAFGEKLYAERGKTAWKEKRAFVIHPVVVNLQIYTAALAGRDYGQFGENGACAELLCCPEERRFPFLSKILNWMFMSEYGLSFSSRNRTTACFFAALRSV